MAYRLTSQGKISSRNLAKPFRAQRKIKDKRTGREITHPLDSLPLGPLGVPVNTTGCFGVHNKFGIGNKARGIVDGEVRIIDLGDIKIGHGFTPSFVKKRSDDGKNKLRQGGRGRGSGRINKKRNIGLMVGKADKIQYENRSNNVLLQVRDDLMTLLEIEKGLNRPILKPNMVTLMHNISGYIKSRMSPEAWAEVERRDNHRKHCIKGQIDARQITMKASYLKTVQYRIRRALLIMKKS